MGPENHIREQLIRMLAQPEIIEESAASEFVDCSPGDPTDLVAVVLNDFFHLGLRTRTRQRFRSTLPGGAADSSERRTGGRNRTGQHADNRGLCEGRFP